MSVFGGNATRKGVVFYSNGKRSAAYRDCKGNITIKTERSSLSDKLNPLRRIPFVRGLVILLDTFIRAWKLNVIIIAAVTALVFMLDNSNQNLFDFDKVYNETTLVIEQYFLLVVLVMGFIATKFTGVARYHGAEHKVFNACKHNLPLTLENVKTQKRYAEECGTNLLVFIFMVLSFAQWTGVSFFISFLIGSSIGYEIFAAKGRITRNVLKPFYIVGFMIQYFIFTSEPGEKELEVAIAAVRGLWEYRE
ncbi:MAG: DUF1385 domain-containing protein [Bacillota bacterium]